AGDTPLHRAAELRDPRMVSMLLKWGADPGVANAEGSTPLEIAKDHKRKQTIQLLEAAPSMLQMAVRRSDLEEVEARLAAGVDPNQRDSVGRTALALAVGSAPITRMLLEAGARSEIADDRGTAPLQLAARAGHLEVLVLLLEAGADPNQSDLRGTSPLLAAAQNRQSEIGLRLLTAGADPDARNRSDESAMFHAIAQNQLELLTAILAAGATHDNVMTNGMTPLGFAVSTDDLSVTEALLNAGAAVDATDVRGRSPLTIAAGRGSLEIVARLIEAGARIEQDSANHRPLLIVALEARHESVALALFEAGAAPDSRNQRGNSALEIASAIGAADVVTVLLESNLQLQDHAKERALLAVMNKLDGLESRDSFGRGSRTRIVPDGRDAQEQRVRYREIALALVRAEADPDWQPDSGGSARVLAERLGMTELLNLGTR
ncbi:MAG: ankyrin repeat domain-containing protein, partial [Deltaproteobacteria bacterium]|nr:ankyrin repeat domain-containing protein [Deltaproteobacteria bacterium]